MRCVKLRARPGRGCGSGCRRRRRLCGARRSGVAWLAGAALALGSGVAPAAPAEELAVSAAASLRGVLGEIGQTFESAHPGVNVALSFGASNVLARQIEAGANADVFLAADEATVASLAAAGLVRPGTRVHIASNRLVVIQAEDLTPPLLAPDDLGRPGLRRIALAAAQVPAGKYAREWLVRRGLLEVVSGRLLDVDDVRATLAAVDSGSADAGIVYATDARVAKSARVAFAVPDDEQPRIAYVAAGIAGRPEAGNRLADAFLRHLLTRESKATLRAAGFGPALTNGGASGAAP